MSGISPRRPSTDRIGDSSASTSRGHRSAIDGPGIRRDARSDVRRRILDHAVSVVEREGVRVSVAHLSPEELIKDVGVPRSTFYRVWSNRAAFYDELIAEVARRTMKSRLEPESLTKGFAAVVADIDRLADPEGRRIALAEAIDIGIQLNYDNVFASVEWRTFITFAASLHATSNDETRERLHAALHARQEHFLVNMAAYYEKVYDRLGLRIPERHGTDFRIVASALAAYIEGLALARLIAPEYVTGPIVPGDPGGRTLAVAGFSALFGEFSEPIPDAL